MVDENRLSDNPQPTIANEKGALRKDDRTDALAILVSHFVEVMDQDAQANAASEHQRNLEEHLRKHISGSLGAKKVRKSWASA